MDEINPNNDDDSGIQEYQKKKNYEKSKNILLQETDLNLNSNNLQEADRASAEN